MRFLSFDIYDEQFGIELEKVREVIAFPQITPAPGTPPHFLGLMRMRDLVVPVIDLRIRMSLVPTLTHDTAVIVCQINGSNVGFVVDMIHTVVSPLENELMPTPAGVTSQGASLFKSVVRRESGLTLILDAENLLTATDEALIQSQAAIEQIKAAS